MAWTKTLNATSPKGQRVEYWQNPGGGYSLGESPAQVRVSGHTVVNGWSCDGRTHAEYARIVREGYVPASPGAHEEARS